jgi:hypothetical protein
MVCRRHPVSVYITHHDLPDDMFQFTCFNVEDPHDPSVGLFNGELAIPGNLLRREVFDPVVNEVSSLVLSLLSAWGWLLAL